jgi:hypothetical protein
MAFYTFNIFRKDSQVIIKEIGRLTNIGILSRWGFFLAALMFIHFHKFGSFDFFGSGIISLFLFAVMCYETLESLVLLFFRENYKEFIAGGNFFKSMIFKIPIACEFTLFVYIFIMDLFVFFI